MLKYIHWNQILLAFVMVLVASCQSEVEQTRSSYQQSVDQILSDYKDQNKPGVAVALIKDDETVFKKGYGNANLEYDIPIATSTVFHVASVSKQFTAFSILLLEDKDKLSLEDDIKKHLPEMPDFGTPITIKHLLHHTSGVRDQWNLLLMAGWRFDDVITTDQIMKLLSRQNELNFIPGEEYLYSNSGYTLLAKIVERVTGKSFAQFTKEAIFDPLQMKSTLFYDDHELTVKNRAYSYSSDSAGYHKSVLNYATVGATSLFTSVDDMTKWVTNFSSLKVGNAKIFQKMRTRGLLNSGDTISYAAGLVVDDYKGRTRIGHGGVDAGYRSYIGWFPDEKISIITLSNDADFKWSSIPMKIADLGFTAKLSELKEVSEQDKNEATKTKGGKPFQIDPDSLQAYTGQYRLTPGFVFTITLENGNLYSQGTNQDKLSLAALSSNEFEYNDVDATVRFIRDSLKRVSRLEHFEHGNTYMAMKMKPFDLTQVDLSEYEGTYYSDELMTSYYFAIEHDQLVAQHQRHDDILLSPTSPDVFGGDQWFFSDVEILRSDTNEIVGCSVTNGRVRSLKFRKINLL